MGWMTGVILIASLFSGRAAGLLADFELGVLDPSQTSFSIHPQPESMSSNCNLSDLAVFASPSFSVDSLHGSPPDIWKFVWDSSSTWSFYLTPKPGYQVTLDHLVIEGGAYVYANQGSSLEVLGHKDNQTATTALDGSGAAYSIFLSSFNNRTDTISFSAFKQEHADNLDFNAINSPPNQAFTRVFLYGEVSAIPEPYTLFHCVVTLSLYGLIRSRNRT